MTTLPRGWVETTIGATCSVVSGSTPKTSEPSYWNGEIAWITPDDMSRHQGKLIASGRRSITRAGLQSCSARILPAGAVLFTSRAPIGYAAIASQPLCTNQGFKSLIPPSGITSDYLYWYMRHATDLIKSRASGTTFAEISGRRMSTIPLVVPPTSEQHRIVAAIEEQFSRIDAATDALRRVRKNANRMRAAVLQAAVTGRLVPQIEDPDAAGALVERLRIEREDAPRRRSDAFRTLAADLPVPRSWQAVALGDLARSIDYGTSEKAGSDEAGIPVLRMGNLGWGTISYDDLKYLSPRKVDARLFLSPGDLLFNRTNSAELVGKTAVFHGFSRPITFASYLIRVQPLPSANLAWVELVMNSGLGRDFIASVRSQQVGQANVNGSKLAAAPIPLPPFEEQARIVAETARLFIMIDRLGAELMAADARASRLRDSILAQAFQGRLVPQNPSDEPAALLLERIRSEMAFAERAAMPSRRQKAEAAATA